jgi:integrase
MAKKRSDGRYCETFRFNGKRYSVYARTIPEVRAKAQEKLRSLQDGEENMVNPTLADYYDELTKIRRREIKESTIRAQRCQFENIAAYVMTNGKKFGELRIKDITRRDIENVRQGLLENGKTPQNLNNCFAHLNHVFNNAVLDDTIPKNPCKALKPLKRDKPLIGENKHRALSVEETQRFFKVAEERNSYYLNNFLIMIKTGMRIGELSALYPMDIDKKNSFIYVRRSISRDELGNYIVGESAKTESGSRDIPLTSEILQIINNQKALNNTLFGLDLNGLLFKSAEGKILREYSINREIKRICRQAGIEYFTCHAFRNTFATRFIEQRPQDYKILSEILGHKDISITLNLYTHVMNENKVKAMSELSIKTS